MSEKKIINDDMIFQSFSKNYVFESNKDQNKITKNEIIEFSFKKNLFLQKPEDTNSNNNNNNPKQFLLSNELSSNIYSKNDTNIQESGHFGKSKYDSKNYKTLIEKNFIKKEPLFYIEEKYNRMKEEEEKKDSKIFSTLPNNSSNSSLINKKLRKIQIVRKKNSIKNNKSSHINHIKKGKDDSFFSFKNNENLGQSYLYKKKVTNNNINLKNISNISIVRDNSYEYNKGSNNTFYKICNTINITEIPKLNKLDNCNIYRNNIQNKKIINSKTNNINPKLKTIINNSNYILKNLKENKENIPTVYNSIVFHNQNINNIIINNNQFCPNIRYINFEPEKTYRNMYMMNKSSNKNIKNENIETFKNESKINNIKKNNSIMGSTSCLRLKKKNSKLEKKIKNNNNSYGNTKFNSIINKSFIGLYKEKTHKNKLDNKKEKCIPCGKLNKTKIFKDKILNYYFEKHGINF